MISVVIPIYNEQESVEAFFVELGRALEEFHEAYEVLFIDDGSTDKTLSMLQSFAKKDKKIRVFSFRKNQGKAEALSFGFQKAKGEIIATLDADLQDLPSELPKLFAKLHDGFDLVCGWRKDRKDPVSKKISSKFFNFIAAAIWGVHVHDYNCGLKAYKSEAAKALRLYGGLHRFIPALVAQKGFLVTEVPIHHDVRRFGKSKFGFSKIWRDLPDIFTMFFLTRYSDRPLHFFGTIGMLLFSIGVLILGYLSMLHFQGQAIGTRPLLVFGMLLVLSGFQVFFTGFLADLMINMSHMSKETGKESERLMLRFSSEA